MGITINSNIASLKVQSRLAESSTSLSRAFERLSSGLRINRASDDVAGLAVAETLKSNRVVLAQGVRNLNDGVSLLSVADAAVEELINITTRVLELAEQASNGTLGVAQRKALDEEAQALSEEFTRIAQSTRFNNSSLFDGSFGELRLQAGYGEAGSISSSLGGVIGDGTFSAAISFNVGDAPRGVKLGDFNSDGYLDMVAGDQGDDAVSVLLGDGAGGFSTAVTYSVSGASRSLDIGDVNNDGTLDIVTGDYDTGTITVLTGDGEGGFAAGVSYSVEPNMREVVLKDFNSDGNLDVLSTSLDNPVISISLGNGDGSFGASTSFATAGNGTRHSVAADFNGDGILDVAISNSVDNLVSVFSGNGDGTFSLFQTFSADGAPGEIASADINADGKMDLVVGDFSGGDVLVLAGAGDGTFSVSQNIAAAESTGSITLADFNGDGLPDLVASANFSEKFFIYENDGSGSFVGPLSIAAPDSLREIVVGDLNADGILDVVTAIENIDAVAVILGNSVTGIGPIVPFSLETRADALQAIAPLERKIDQLSLQRAVIGAFQSRLEVAINNTESRVVNLSLAESRVRDVDVAQEAARLVSLSVLQDAGIATLAQANQTPELVLTLLE